MDSMVHDDSASSTPAKPSKLKISQEQCGVWQILSTSEGHRERYQRFIHETPKSLPSLYRLLRDIYALSPTLVVLFLVCQLWAGCQEAIKIHISSQVLRKIEQCLRVGVPDYSAMCYLLVLRLVVTALATMLSWYSADILDRLQYQVTSHFQMRIMKTQLRHDLSQLNNPVERTNVTADQAWHSFVGLLSFYGLVLTVISQSTLVIHLARHDSGGPLFALICLLRPLLSKLVGGGGLRDKVCVIRNNNETHQRMEALILLTAPHIRQDVISNNLQDFIISEYQNAIKLLGDVIVKPLWSVFLADKTPYVPTLLALLGDLPTVYCALLALWSPKSISFASITILQESSLVLVRHVSAFFKNIERVKQQMQSIHEIYDFETQLNTELNDSSCTEDKKSRAGQGMQFELRNVSFTYPGSQTTREALKNVNLTIKPGQFVVIVGSNGSGKSTLIKLLLRLYKPSNCTIDSELQDTSGGQILIDNQPGSSFPEDSLRQSTAVFSQDNLIYQGFSLGENIGLGFPSLISNDEAIEAAAEKAGAKEVLKRMKDGANTILDPLVDYHHYNVRRQDNDHPLKKVLEELRRPVEVSGGERQRIVAARTFMKFNSGQIRFLAVDEPSSALDAEGEEYLLDNLLKEREGKTIVFVTHKFGKLTKQADLIVCMKEGAIVESGTHSELMKKGGEYRKLYDIQSKAFQDDAVTPTGAAGQDSIMD